MRIVVFVCPHGAGKSRIAAAWFNADPPPGWVATSAGVEPQEHVSIHAPRLLAGTPAEAALDGAAPRPLHEVVDAMLAVAIDCVRDSVPGASIWQLDHPEFDHDMAEEIRQRVGALARRLAMDVPT